MATVAVGLGFVVAGTANAESASYKCVRVDPPTWPVSGYATAIDCVGPEGSFHPVSFNSTSPLSARFCLSGFTYRDGQGRLDVDGRFCS
ncbi:hypothetical protein EV192_10821 [Actinocrispum wychmicini]|uniref:Uncharacterized protein n=2 Tax=Actinocrispum wychmicini TaxID=1213861 RepID=A0A4R2J6S0_9PSEU|nr:hypothetical protein EV192_10821 [Actinocrispum wychmicini]